ncbi:hypothetical protein M885DRAFT_540394 [Pelagophyceae sp. CCMP2097]|nr:hypothetical protein M885DRAFT_540394 [Pelagophyceae sp. CCMP2097]|mmetsp:Transcript_32238/g.111452  ORF Transcript_32238/g.111452 Transcript_32238/m.111452 type:complete len:260 (-) Transcript_32238:38-817(-)
MGGGVRLCVWAGLVAGARGLVFSGVEVPHAKVSGVSRALDLGGAFGEAWPYKAADLVPEDPSSDGLFYLWPKFAHHAAETSRDALAKFYGCALPPAGTGAVLDLCASFTSHYPSGWRGERCAVLGLNAVELLANPSKTEWKVKDLNKDATLPYADGSFDVVTNSLSVDYLRDPLAVFSEMRRVLKPGGLACNAFTNRCFPSKVVPIWLRPFDDAAHARIVAAYFHFSGGWADISVVDVSPGGFEGQKNPMYIVCARKAA